MVRLSNWEEFWSCTMIDGGTKMTALAMLVEKETTDYV